MVRLELGLINHGVEVFGFIKIAMTDQFNVNSAPSAKLTKRICRHPVLTYTIARTSRTEVETVYSQSTAPISGGTR